MRGAAELPPARPDAVEHARGIARADAVTTEAARWADDTALYRAIEACREARLALVNNVTPRLTVDTLLARVARRAA